MVLPLYFFSGVKDLDDAAVQRKLEQVIGDATTTSDVAGLVIESVKVLHELGVIASAYSFHS